MAVHRPRCYLDITIGSEPAGRLVIELFVDKAPKTCENFRQLCTEEKEGLSYRMCPFHRVIDEFMVQTGDITKGDGTGGDSIYGGEFEDENLGWRDCDAPGLVCMANRGKGTNSSQFFITLESVPHLNNKHTIFGHLVSGQETLDRIAKVDVDSSDRPKDSVLIARSGELERKRKQTATTSASGAESSRDRGRRPDPKEVHHSPRGERRKRRESDNAIDGTLRGRPLNRSHSRSQSRHKSASASESPSRSLPRKHKRRRSPSPSRGPEEEEGKRDHAEAEERRRRRSLPNQYHNDKTRRGGSRERPQEHRDKNGDYDRGGGRDWDRGGRHSHDDRSRKFRRDDRYRPQARRNEDNTGRLGGGGGFNEDAGSESGIKFKGRGSMKYREPDRRW